VKALLDLPGARGYLNTASLGLPPEPVLAALRAELDVWAAGGRDAPDYDVNVDASRAAFARLAGVDEADVAVSNQVSVCVGVVAGSLPASARVLVAEGDFASLVYPFLARGGLRVEEAPLDRLADAVDGDTDMIAVSAAQSSDGRVADLDAIAASAAHHGAMTVVDATQAAGWLPLDASRFDFTATAAYKWLLSPRGTAFLTVRPGRLDGVRPLLAGWYSAGADRWGETLYGTTLRLAQDARRLDVSPAWLSWVGTEAALGVLLDVGVDAIHAHDVALANRVRAGLGMPESDTAFVAVEGAGVDERLRAAGIAAAMRAGRARLSFHLYNDSADADRALEALTSGAR
jgi:selenocysteine lyase/cysteine desulfurase